MDGIVGIICLYLWGTAIVVGGAIVFQKLKNSRQHKEQDEIAGQNAKKRP